MVVSRMADGQPMMPLSDAAYGEQKTFREIQGGAPMAQAQGVPQGAPVDPMAGVVGLGEPSQRPGEPVTAGSPLGPGPGPAPSTMAQDEAARLQKFLPAIERVANQPESSQTLRNLVQYLKGL